VAHEINLPLSGILLGARLTLETVDAPAPDIERLRPIPEGLVDESKRGVTTIEEMRMLLRNVQTALEPVDLVAVVRTAVLFARPVLDDLGVELRFEPAAGKLVVRGDAVQLQAAVVNLLRNAAEATATQPAGSRRVVIDVGRSGVGNAETMVIVGDSGPSFPAEAIRVPLETTKPYGTGLGLYVVQNTVRNHGGHITIGRSPLGGVEVRIVLPCAPLARRPSQPLSQPPPDQIRPDVNSTDARGGPVAAQVDDAGFQ
jgi:two-component system sensor histidine kinase TtrS